MGTYTTINPRKSVLTKAAIGVGVLLVLFVFGEGIVAIVGQVLHAFGRLP